MKVLHFYKSCRPDSFGGIEQVIDQIATGSITLGLEPEVLSLTPHPKHRTEKFNGYLVHRVKQDFEIASCGFSAAAFLRFAQLAQKADVIHYHFPWPFMDMVHFATLVKKPSLVTYHSDIIRQRFLLKIYRPLMRKFLESTKQIVATSPNYVVTSGVLQEYIHKVSVIPIGLDRATYLEPSSEKLAFWSSRFQQKFFLFLGVLRSYKGLEILLQAAKGVNYPIVIVGAGPIEEKLKQQAKKSGLRNVHLLGGVSELDKFALLRLCFAILFPSHLRSEAFGVSLLEGAMYGKPMISCEIGTGTTFINIGNETGLVVPPSDPAALRGAMSYLWDHPFQAGEMGRSAQQRYMAYFTADRMVRSYVSLYEKL